MIPYLECDEMTIGHPDTRLSKIKEYQVVGATHFKKAFFWTGMIDEQYPFFMYNYSVNRWAANTGELTYRYETMLYNYNLGIFDLPRIATLYGLCREKFQIAMEWFSFVNMDRFVKLCRFDDKTLKRYLPTFLVELLESVIELNSKNVVMCDWKMDQWMVVDKRGALKLTDVDSCYNAYEITVGKLAACNCPFEMKPFRDPKRPPKQIELWTQRTWGDTHWFKHQENLYETRLKRGMPEGYTTTCQSYNKFLWEHGLPIHEYWFQAARLTEMTWVLIMKPGEVVDEDTELELFKLVNEAADVWNPISVKNYTLRVREILADYLDIT